MSVYKQGEDLFRAIHMQKPILAIYRGGKEIFRYNGLTTQTKAAIIEAFGQEEGNKIWLNINAYAAKHPNIAPIINKSPLLSPYFIQGGELKYLLLGIDDLVDGALADRINSEVKWIPQGSCTRTDGGYILNGDNGYLKANDALLFDLGNHFRVMAEFTTIANSYVVIDFGSIAAANKNIAFWTGQRNGQYIDMNWKMQGNNSNPGVQINIPVTGGHHYFTWAIVDAGNGYDKFVASIDGVTQETDGIIPKATNFGGYSNWDNKNFYIGRGVTNGFAMSNGSVIHNFMIHVID